jgi:hypothetical protein
MPSVESSMALMVEVNLGHYHSLPPGSITYARELDTFHLLKKQIFLYHLSLPCSMP